MGRAEIFAVHSTLAYGEAAASEKKHERMSRIEGGHLPADL